MCSAHREATNLHINDIFTSYFWNTRFVYITNQYHIVTAYKDTTFFPANGYNNIETSSSRNELYYQARVCKTLLKRNNKYHLWPKKQWDVLDYSI